VTRFVDGGAVLAGWVGLGMALTVGVSFLLVIPIEPVYWYLAIPGGLLIGYYANQRSDRRAGPWSRILANALYAGLITALTWAILLLAVKAIFFVADDGYRDVSQGGSLECAGGADCVYARYLADGRGDDLAASGVTDTDSFTAFYWGQQLQTAGLLVVFVMGGALGGGALYGILRPKPKADPPTDPEAAGDPGAATPSG
jgi:hypothetical protein